jgi:hypothetical protein
VVTGEYRLGDVRHVTADSRRLREEFGWKPETDFGTGMREFATVPLRGAGEPGAQARPAGDRADAPGPSAGPSLSRAPWGA